MQVSGQTETAVKLALRIWNESAGDPEAAMLASEVLSADVPEWHFRLIRDRVRNAAYDAALRRAIRPGTRVLDIGSGTGLLAMMAARAGAAQVFSCEINPAIADAAREIVAANGFSDRVQIVAKHSNKLQADTDLNGRVDIIVSEIVSNDMLGQEVLAAMEYAVGNLLKPGGQVIPAKGTVKMALAFDPYCSEARMETAEGFDLTAFNRLAKPSYSVSSVDKHLRLMSEAADLFEFDFRAAAPNPSGRTRRTLIAQGGPVNCIAQWIHLQMDDEGSYENKPGERVYSCWATIAHPLPKQVELKAGDTVEVNGSHDLCSVRIWASAE